MLAQIMAQLGIDGSFLPQFIIIVVMFILGKFVFYGHLQKIIEKREEDIGGSESDSENKFDDATKMSEAYKAKIDEANKSALQKINDGKVTIIKANDKEYRSEEEKINTYIEEQRKEVEVEIGKKKDEVLKEAENLSSQLINKIIS